MKKLLLATIAALALDGGAHAKDMFYSLAAEWCIVGGSPTRFTITEDGILFDGQPGEAPRCKLKSATNRNEPLGEHVITWRCDPTPPHEPEDKPTPKAKFYDVTERQSGGGKKNFVVRSAPIDRSSYLNSAAVGRAHDTGHREHGAGAAFARHRPCGSPIQPHHHLHRNPHRCRSEGER